MAGSSISIIRPTADSCLCQAHGPDGSTNRMMINATAENIQRYIDSAEPVQKVLPALPPEQREFLVSGLTPEGWNTIFGKQPA